MYTITVISHMSAVTNSSCPSIPAVRYLFWITPPPSPTQPSRELVPCGLTHAVTYTLPPASLPMQMDSLQGGVLHPCKLENCMQIGRVHGLIVACSQAQPGCLSNDPQLSKLAGSRGIFPSCPSCPLSPRQFMGKLKLSKQSPPSTFPGYRNPHK